MDRYKFVLLSRLSDDEYQEYFDLMKSHLVNLYGQEALSQENFESWRDNRKNCQQKKYYIKMFCDELTCGYADVLFTESGNLYFCDIIIAEKHRKTTLLLQFLKFIFSCKELANFDEIYFHINHKNSNSLKTFSHLGYEIVEENKNSNKFKILRKNALAYLNKLCRR